MPTALLHCQDLTGMTSKSRIPNARPKKLAAMTDRHASVAVGHLPVLGLMMMLKCMLEEHGQIAQHSFVSEARLCNRA